jgi:3-methyladenine DNA glycosylase Tag
MTPPTQIDSPQTADYLAVITKAIFHAGMTWAVVEGKWQGFEAAFHGFDPERVAAMSPADVDRLMEDTSIIRNRRKIEATIVNAQMVLDLIEQHGDMPAYLASLGDFAGQVAGLKRDFRFMGDTSAYYVLYVVGQPVPDHAEWRAGRQAAKQRG